MQIESATLEAANVQNDAHGREPYNIVVVGHVDHGKSTVIGRLLADTDSLPTGKLDQVRAECERNAKPFEYAFLLDALENERKQGITIDTARSFFKSKKRDYIIIDAPGHIEFLKNMISGAARAEAAVLVIDAKEGVRENSRRHGYMLSFLGIKQVAVLVNKMDLVNYDQARFDEICTEYTAFLEKVGVEPKAFVPISAFYGENLVTKSQKTPWYQGPALLELMDSFQKEKDERHKPLRFPVQDVYKFTEEGDDRRIIAGRVETGMAQVGEEVVFLPSGKKAKIKTIEEFNSPVRQKVSAGQSVGFTLEPEIYVQPGEIMTHRSGSKAVQPPQVATRLLVNLFWMGKAPLVSGRKYKLKIATAESTVWLDSIKQVLDASDLSAGVRTEVKLHDVAECIFESAKPLAFDTVADSAQTGRFVIVDNYEISGGGIILGAEQGAGSVLEKHLEHRELHWERSALTPGLRSGRYGQLSGLLVLAGQDADALAKAAKRLEERLFQDGRYVYFLGLSNAVLGLHADVDTGDRTDLLYRLGETAFLFAEAGAIIITSIPGLNDTELELIRLLNRPHKTFVVRFGEGFLDQDQADISIAESDNPEQLVKAVEKLLQDHDVLVDYSL
jgi:bifunctional enzyme CysN/CysC